MGQALYRQYRPKSLADVAGQDHITATLKKAIESNQISHAYLLTGPRGVGKTTVARIMAHMVNGLAYDDDSSHLDIIEIDAASNRRIDEIRELRERVYTSPTELKYKVYIIDEVHMLTREAFNALLKTLEEPPAHVIFILATTDTHKLPETIISRTQHYSFKPISKDSTISRLKEIAKDEKIKVSPEALELLAEHGDGSLRDSIGLLDQVKSVDKEVSAETVRELLGLPPDAAIDDLLSSVRSNKGASDIVNSLSELYSSGYQASVLASILSKKLRQELIDNKTADIGQTLDLLAQLIEVPASSEPERLLEIVLLKSRSNIAPVIRTEKIVTETVEVVDQKPKIKAAPAEKPKSIELQPISGTDQAIWQAILKEIKSQYNTLYGVLRMAQPSFKEDKLVLAFSFAFHEKRIKEASNKKIIEDLASKLAGRRLGLECVVDKDLANNQQDIPSEPKVNDSLSTISSIFNGAELLES
jgi:DNA polymerase-3 subunit gamma/tau